MARVRVYDGDAGFNVLAPLGAGAPIKVVVDRGEIDKGGMRTTLVQIEVEDGKRSCLLWVSLSVNPQGRPRIHTTAARSLNRGTKDTHTSIVGVYDFPANKKGSDDGNATPADGGHPTPPESEESGV